MANKGKRAKSKIPRKVALYLEQAFKARKTQNKVNKANNKELGEKVIKDQKGPSPSKTKKAKKRAPVAAENTDSAIKPGNATPAITGERKKDQFDVDFSDSDSENESAQDFPAISVQDETMIAAPVIVQNKTPTVSKAPATPKRTCETLYQPGDVILLVGEGDLSFSVALAKKMRNKAFLMCTTYDSKKQLNKKYPDTVNEHLRILKQIGNNEVRFNVDARELNTNGNAGNGNSQYRGLKGDSFTKIVFNFPNLGMDSSSNGGAKLSDSDIASQHQDLLLGFFKAARECLDTSTSSEIHVTTKSAQPYLSWKIPSLAKQAGLKCGDSVKFNAPCFPGYKHRRTNGLNYEKGRGFGGDHDGASGLGGVDIDTSNVVSNARTQIFHL